MAFGPGHEPLTAGDVDALLTAIALAENVGERGPDRDAWAVLCPEPSQRVIDALAIALGAYGDAVERSGEPLRLRDWLIARRSDVLHAVLRATA